MEPAPTTPASPSSSPVDAASGSASDPAMMTAPEPDAPATGGPLSDAPAPFQSPAATTPEPALHAVSEQRPPSPLADSDPILQQHTAPRPDAEPEPVVHLVWNGPDPHPPQPPAPGPDELWPAPPAPHSPPPPHSAGTVIPAGPPYPMIAHPPPLPVGPWPTPPAPSLSAGWVIATAPAGPSFPGIAIPPFPLIAIPPSPGPRTAAADAPRSKAKRGAAPAAAKDASRCPTCKSGGRNLVVCIDGTSNQFSKKNTNVVELYSRLLKDNAKQVTFYNSGIGTYARPSWRSFSYYKQVLANKLDLAFALRFDKIILSAYAWLADNYVEGDRIFLFGFSRGAYQVRALSAMIHRVGLIHKGNADQIPFAYELYAVSDEDEDSPPPEGTSQLLHMLYLLFLPIHAFLNRLWNAWDSAQNSTALVNPDARSNPTSEATPGADAQSEGSESSSEWLSDESEQCIPTTQKRFKKAFARDVKVHFVGAWDTVSSVGLVRDKTLPGTTDGMSHVCYFRHALALHERRVKFLPEFVNGGLGPASLRDKVVRVLDSIAEDDGGPFDALSLVRLVLSTLASTAAGLLYTKPTAPTSEGDHAIADAEPERPGQHPRGMSASQITQKPDIDAPPPHTKEVWFPGSHSDIGGGASPNENMRKFGPALRWMSFEARLAGLKISKEPRRWDTELRRTNSLTPFWKMIELLPVKRLTYDSVSGTTYRPHLWAKRPFQSGQLVYDAVSERTKKLLCEAGLEVEDDPYLGAEDFLKSLDQYIENRDILSERDRIKLHLLSNGALGQQQLRDLSDDISGPLSTMLSICRDKIEDPRALSVASTIQLLLYGLEYSFDVLRNSRPLHAALELSMVEDTWTFPRPLRAHVAPVRTVACTHGGARIVSGAWDDSIRVWDTATGEQIRPPIEGSEFDVDSIAVSPDGRRAVMTPYQAASALKVWDLDEGICLLLLVGHVDRIYCAAYSQDGWYIASGSSDGIIIWDAETGERLGDNLAFGSPPTTIFTVAFSNDGRYLAAGDSNCTIYLWDVVTRTLSFALLGHNQGVRSIMFSPDDKRLVSGSDDGSVRIWRVDTREVAHVLTGHTSNVWAVAFSPKGRHVASASGDGSVRVWSADSGKPVGVPLEGHNSDVRCVAFSPDGSRVVSGADDGAIRIWDRMPSIPLADRSALRDYAYPVDMLIPPAVVYPPADPANISLPPSEAGNVQEEAANAAGPSEHGDHLPDYRHHKDGEVIMQTDKDLTSENDDSETHEDGALSPVSSASKDTSSIHDGSAASQGTDFCKNRNPESTQSGIHSAPEHGPRPCSSPERRGAPERSRPAL